MIRFRALGSADLRDDNGNELRAVLSRPGQLGLLAYLALARPRGFHRRDTLVGLFWAETGQDQARNALRQAVHRLRHELGSDVIESRGAEELSVNSKILCSDVGAFDDALAEGKVSEALSQYRGGLLPGFFLSDAPGFEQWLETERARLRQRAASAAWELSRTETVAGQASMASHWARWAYALNPDDEADLRKLIDVLVRAGDHSGALHAYQEFSERVSREYEIEPSKATRALVEPLRVSTGGAMRLNTIDRPAQTRFAPYTPHSPPPPAATASAIDETEEVGDESALPQRRWRRLVAAATAVASLAVVLTIIGWRHAHDSSEPPAEAIAVFPFSVRGRADLHYLREGMVDLLSAKLDGVAGLRSIDPRAVISATRVSDSSLTALPPAVAGISRRLGAGAFVIGDVVELAGRVNVSGVLYETRQPSQPITKISVEGDATELPQLVDQLAGRLLAARTKARDPAMTQLAALTTRSLPALAAYLEGEREFRAGHAEAARDAFRTAIREDSTFALAYMRLATTRGWSVTTRVDPIPLLAMARRYSSRLAPLARQLLDGYDAYYHSNGTIAVEIFTNITRTYPDRLEAWFMLGEAQSHLALFTGHSPAEARPAFLRVLALDPDNPHALVHLARLAATDQRYDELKAIVARYLATRPDGDRMIEMRALRAFSLGDSVDAAALIAETRRVSTIDLYSIYLAATSYSENMAAANATASALLDRAPRIDDGFAVVLSLVPVPGLMQGRIVRGAPESGMDGVNAGWPAVLRTLLIIDAPVAIPVANLRALQDTISRWRPQSDDAAAFFPSEMKMLPQIHSYLLGLLSVQLRNPAGVDSALGSLKAMMQAANDSGVSSDLVHLVRAEQERSRNHLREALSEVEQFQFSSTHYASFSFRPAYAHARFLRAEILHGLGRDEEAVRWYGSLSEQYDSMYLPLVHLRMAEILRRRGDRVQALKQYRRLAALWKDCDPELRPLVVRAAAAIEAKAN